MDYEGTIYVEVHDRVNYLIKELQAWFDQSLYIAIFIYSYE